MNRTARTDLVKVKIPLPPGQWHGGEAEWLWAKPVGPSTYQLDNIPALAPNLSLGDTVTTTDEDNVPVFSSVAERGGHSTYWLFFSKGVSDVKRNEFLDELRSVACDYEGVKGRMVAVDVRPEADIHQVYGMLESAEKEGLLKFEEGFCGHPH